MVTRDCGWRCVFACWVRRANCGFGAERDNRGDGLDALVKDLLVLSQLETGEVKMNFEKVDMTEVIEEIFDQLEKIAQGRGTTLKMRVSRPGPIRVKADSSRITQVMTNLIENAIKYGTDNGKVVVSLEEEKKYVAISVRDDGPGIPPEHLSRIFERFYRVEKSRSKDRGGTGLGLAIVKHILGAHKSKVTVMSKIDKGTTFQFKLDRVD